MRGIVPSTLLRLWEGQCLHKAAPTRRRGGPATREVCFASPCVELCHLLCFVCGRGSASTRPPPGSGEVQPHQFQPGKYEIFPGRGMSNQFGKAALQGVKEVQPFSGRPRRHRRLGCFASPRGIVPSTLLRLWEGQCLQPHQFQPGKDIFSGRGMSNQTSRGLIWQGCLAGS